MVKVIIIGGCNVGLIDKYYNMMQNETLNFMEMEWPDEVKQFKKPATFTIKDHVYNFDLPVNEDLKPLTSKFIPQNNDSIATIKARLKKQKSTNIKNRRKRKKSKKK